MRDVFGRKTGKSGAKTELEQKTAPKDKDKRIVDVADLNLAVAWNLWWSGLRKEIRKELWGKTAARIRLQPSETVLRYASTARWVTLAGYEDMELSAEWSSVSPIFQSFERDPRWTGQRTASKCWTDGNCEAGSYQ